MHNQRLLDQYDNLIDSKKQINEQINNLEQQYIIEFAKLKGLSDGDMVKTPSGQIGFLMISQYTKYDRISFWIKAIKKDGKASLHNVATFCKFEDLILVKKVGDV